MATRSSSGGRPACLARRALDQRRRELLDAESHRFAEVDVRELRLADAAQPFVFDWDAVAPEPPDRLMHPGGVPGQLDVRQQGVRAGDRLHLFTPVATFGRHLARVHRALQLVHGFAAVQQGMDLAAEVLDGDVAAQEYPFRGGCRVQSVPCFARR